MDEPANEFAIVTRTGNKDIRIQPHGTGKIKLPNVPAGTGEPFGRDASNNLVRITTNPRVFVFNFGGAAGNPDVTAGGNFEIRYNSGTSFTSMDIGDTAKMKIEGKIQTRNANNLIAGMTFATSATIGLSLSSLGWNWSNANVGGFTAVVSATRIGTSTYRVMVDLYVKIFDGTVTEVKQIRTDSTSITGISNGGVNGSLAITYAEANAANQLFLYSGVIEIFKNTQ